MKSPCLVFALLVLIGSTTGCDPYRNMTQAEIGQKVYKTQCALCHQIDGSGVPDMQPALVGSELVQGEDSVLIEIILNGSNATVLRERDIYDNFMTSFAYLRDFEIAAVATYLRSDFGNQASPLTEERVAELRANLSE